MALTMKLTLSALILGVCYTFQVVADGESKTVRSATSEATYGSYESTQKSTYSNEAPYGGGYGNTSYAPTYNPWEQLPGTLPKEAYGGPLIYEGKYYNPQSIYASYLSSRPFNSYSARCAKSYGQSPYITTADLNMAFNYAYKMLREYELNDRQIYSQGNYLNVSVHSSSHRHHLGYNDRETLFIKQKEGLFMKYATLYLMRHLCLSKYDVAITLPRVRIGPTSGYGYGDQSCHATYDLPGWRLKCNEYAYSKFRSIDGSCNNLHFPYWGKSNVCHIRLVPPAYDDGVAKPRSYSADGGYLPNPRVVSNVVNTDVPVRAYYTILKSVWGQWINHDLTNTPTAQASYAGMIDCCGKSYHPNCFPIAIPKGDYQNKNYQKTCMNFVRSAACPLCVLGPKQQMNIATSFMDLSALYGATPMDSKRLRTYVHGKLKTGRDINGKHILPPNPHPYQDQCSAPNGMTCFDAGDPRVNQHPALMGIHMLWLRLHNHHCDGLHKVNPHWNDERLFQEARRIAIAEFQKLTYEEYLPIVFGPTLMKYFRLDTYNLGYTRYEPYTDPTTWNDYATAACRFGHSQVNSFYPLIKPYTSYSSSNYTNGFWLKDWFFNPEFIHKGMIDHMVKGWTVGHAMAVDPWLVNDIKNYLYRAKGERSGLDLAALNLQRGRDHGLPPYHVYLDYCYGFKAYSWEDLAKFIPYQHIALLKTVYKSWRDVDLWSAIVGEKKHGDADVGPTATCILGIQYNHILYGDRAFYTHMNEPGSFTRAQLANINSVCSVANLLCKVSDYMDTMQRYAFFPESSYNPRIPCNQYPALNYGLWYEKPY